MKPLKRFLQEDKPRIDAKIKKYYKSYKNFICCEELPDFKIEYTDSRIDKTINYKAQVLPYQKPIVVRYNIATLDERSEDFKYTLVHEFTHLYDYFIQSKIYEDDFLKRNLMLYTEYHAVQIEILFCYNVITKITDKVDFFKINMDKLLVLPVDKNITYTNTVLKFLENKTVNNFYIMKRAYMYACGASAILSQLTDRNFKKMAFEEPYTSQMNEITELLSTVKYNEVPSGILLKQIGDINAQITFHE